MAMSDWPIFSVMGIEIEYMLVDKKTLNVQPQSDMLLKRLAGQQVNEVALNEIAISNELVMHVLEFKNNGPKPPQAPISEHFQNAILAMQPLLQEHDLLFLPTGAHPWMNPNTETLRWPHDNNAIYNQYDQIFNCSGHGWANLQSMHINLPYANDEEFCQLHNVIRLILPLLPAIAASTPILDGKATGMLDSRLYFYEHNQKKLPKITGDTIPEFIKTPQEYQQKILTPMYDEISPYDPQGILQYPWLNSRAAIPKFDQKAIEIRIIDTQECVTADIAIAKAVFEILKWWCHTSCEYLHKPYDTKKLKSIMDETIYVGLNTKIQDPILRQQWHLPSKANTIRDAWSFLIEQVSAELDDRQQRALEHILSQGNLSERILKSLTHQSLFQVYDQLSHCLLTNEQLAL